MKLRHVAFCLEQAYGHILPTVGIALELLRRGHRVSYAVAQSFARAIDKIGAHSVIISPLNIRSELLNATSKVNDCFEYSMDREEVKRFCNSLRERSTAHSLSQLESLYRNDKPDVIIHDDCLDRAGRALADKWRIPRIRHHSQFIDQESLDYRPEDFAIDNLVLMTVPKFFQPEPESLDGRFKFVGFIPEGRKEPFSPLKFSKPGTKPILVSATTGLLPQLEFCRLMVNCFKNESWDVILSISGSHDSVSAIDSGIFDEAPKNFQINRTASNFQILEYSCLYIGQGGQGGVLEAIFCGIPQIVIPPSPYHYSVGCRLEQLRLGRCMPFSSITKESLADQIRSLLNNEEMLQRIGSVADSMRSHRGAELAANLIEDYLSL